MKVGILGIVLVLIPGLAGAESLAAGSATALNDKEGAETERIVTQIQQLADESRRGAPQFSMIGEVRGGGSSWWVNGQEFFINESTVITGALASGKTIEVRGLLGNARELIARHVTVFEANSGERAANRPISAVEARALR